MTDDAETIRLARSFLFVPAVRPDRFENALAAGADAVVIDLEDAVEPERKEEARQILRSWLASNRSKVAVRVNPPTGEVGRADLAVLTDLQDRMNVVAVIVPKAEHASQLATVASACSTRTTLLPIVESAAGLACCTELAEAPGVARLMLGPLDLAIDLGIDFSFERGIASGPIRFKLVLASRLAGIAAPVDGPETELHNYDLVHDSMLRAYSMGFRGKVCIHPDQVRPVHEALKPGADKVSAARRIVAAGSYQRGVFQLDGRMVDKPVQDWAREVLDNHER